MSGFETCKALFASDQAHHILLGVRGSPQRAEDPIAKLKQTCPTSKSTVEGLAVDVDSDEAITKAFETVAAKFGYIDVLINNAGADYGAVAAKGDISQRQAWLQAYNTNVAGTHIMTHTFAPLLLKSSIKSPKLIFITSGQASLTEMAEERSPNWQAPEAGWPKSDRLNTIASYRASKVGMNMMYLEWVKLFANDPIRVFCISPGFLATGLSFIGADTMKSIGAGDPAMGGNTVKDVVEGKMHANAGKVVDGRQGRNNVVDIQPW